MRRNVTTRLARTRAEARDYRSTKSLEGFQIHCLAHAFCNSLESVANDFSLPVENGLGLFVCGGDGGVVGEGFTISRDRIGILTEQLPV